MSYQPESEINDLEVRLNEFFEKLLEKLRGKEPPESLKIPDKEPNVVINDRDLRLAIDHLLSILKEVKKLCK